MSRYVSPVFQIDDINGFSQVGAKLVFYTPGTVSLKTIYSDSGLTTPRTNPVTSVSSNAGAIYPDIYLDGLYDVYQQDASGTVDTDDGAAIWNRPNVGDVSTGAFELWVNDTTYSIPEIVLGSDDEYYRSLVDANQGNDPTTSATNWEQLQFGRVWNTNVTYAIGNSVYGSDGDLYIALISQSGNDPITDDDNWRKSISSTLETPIATTSGTTADFTGIPSWVKKITVMFSGVSTNGTSDLLVRIGDSGGVEATGYTAGMYGTVIPSTIKHATGFGVADMTNVGSTIHGSVTLKLLDSSNFIWASQGVLYDLFSTGFMSMSAGTNTLDSVLTDVRITTVLGTDTFDAGSVNIMYE